MLKKVGRLDHDNLLEIRNEAEKIFKFLRQKDYEKAEKWLVKIGKTPNYFIREELGKIYPEFEDQEVMESLMEKMLNHKFYGVRATAVFYFYNKYSDDPQKIIDILNNVYKTVPWETENLIIELWQQYPDFMKVEMKKWLESEDESKRSLSFHGLDTISDSDPMFVMEFLDSSIDDESEEVQKKIVHVLTQVARSRPAEAYPYIREWLQNSQKDRSKLIWASMKKLAGIVSQRGRKDVSTDFVILTQQTIQDWKNDSNEEVSALGLKLYNLINK